MKNFLKKFGVVLAGFLAFASIASATILTVPQGGTGVGTITGIVKGNGTSAFSPITIGSGLNLTGSTLSATGITPSLTATQIPYGSPSNLMTSNGNSTTDGSTNLNFTRSIGSGQVGGFYLGNNILGLGVPGFTLQGYDGSTSHDGIFEGVGINGPSIHGVVVGSYDPTFTSPIAFSSTDIVGGSGQYFLGLTDGNSLGDFLGFQGDLTNGWAFQGVDNSGSTSVLKVQNKSNDNLFQVFDDGTVKINDAYSLPTANAASAGETIINDGSGGSAWGSPIDGITLTGAGTSGSPYVVANPLAAGGAALIGETSGVISNPPGIGSDEETFLGAGAGAGASIDANVFLGYSAGQSASAASDSVFIGRQAGQSATGGSNSIFIGDQAGASDTATGNDILIGSGTSDGGFADSIALGVNATNTAANQFMIGSAGGAGITQITASAYPSTRDDTGSFTPANFIYTDSDGNFLSSPVSALGGQPLGQIAFGTGTGLTSGSYLKLFDSGGGSKAFAFDGPVNGNDFEMNDTSGADQLNTSSFFAVGASSGGQIFQVIRNSGNPIVQLGDLSNVGNSTVLVLDDSSQTLDFNKPNFSINGLNYVWPSSNGIGGRALINDGSGGLTWAATPFSSIGSLPSTIAGYGILDGVSIPADNDLTGQTTAVSSIAAIASTPSDETYQVSGYVTITAVTLDVIQLQVTYVDETSTTRTQVFFPQGVTSANLATTGAFTFPTMNIRAKMGTTVTVKTVLTTGTGSISYDVGATITQL